MATLKITPVFFLLLFAFSPQQLTSQGISGNTSGDLAPASQQLIAPKLEGQIEPVNLLVPAEFQSASKPDAISIRDKQLTKLNSNPGRRARYSEWMVYDWNSPEKTPWLMVASLGSLIQHQGNISKDQWIKLKTEVLSLQSKHHEARITALEEKIREGAKLD